MEASHITPGHHNGIALLDSFSLSLRFSPSPPIHGPSPFLRLAVPSSAFLHAPCSLLRRGNICLVLRLYSSATVCPFPVVRLLTRQLVTEVSSSRECTTSNHPKPYPPCFNDQTGYLNAAPTDLLNQDVHWSRCTWRSPLLSMLMKH